MDRRIGLSRQVAACFSDGRNQDQIEHSLETLIAQRVHGIALGYEDLNNHGELRHDPVLGLLSGKLQARRSDCAVLAGKSTLNRLEHAPESAEDRYRKFTVNGEAMKALFVDLFIRPIDRRRRLPMRSPTLLSGLRPGSSRSSIAGAIARAILTAISAAAYS